MIDLYTAATPNGSRIELMLEELGLAYSKHLLNLSRGDNYSEKFLKLNPSARIPVIVDHDDAVNDKPFVLTQSAAILLYLAEKTGRLLPYDRANRAKALEWIFFDATDIATTRFDAFYLSRNNQSAAASVLIERVMDYYSVYDQHLACSRFLAGNTFSIADIAAYPWAKAMEHTEMKKLINLQRWVNEIGKRASVQKLSH